MVMQQKKIYLRHFIFETRDVRNETLQETGDTTRDRRHYKRQETKDVRQEM